MPKKMIVSLVIAAAAGLIAVFLVNKVIEQKTTQLKESASEMRQNLTTVVIAKKDIPAGTALKENMLQEKTLDKRMLQPRAALSIDRVVDKVAIVSISAGEQVLLNKLTIPGEETSLANKVPKGKRAITIPVDNFSSVGGMIKPGDHVDIVGWVPVQGMAADGKVVTQMTTMPLFQDVLVLAVGQQFTTYATAKKAGEESRQESMMTLALSPTEANLVSFVQEQGKIRLVLRSPEDTQLQPVVPANWDTLMRTIMPQAFEQKEEAPQTPKPKVEIIRGTNREIKSIE